MGKPKYVGQDGALYDTFEERMQADARYRQQEKQNKLIEEQNKLLQKQQIENERLEQQRQDELIRKMKEETDRRDSDERIRIEDERIQRLFDDLGLNKRIYDDYIHSIFNPEEFGFKSCEDYDLDEASEDLNEIRNILDYDEERLSKYLSNKYESLKEYHDSFTDYTKSYHLKEYILYESIIRTKEAKNGDVELTCGNCGATVDKDADTCDSCGATFVQEKKKIPPSLYVAFGGLIIVILYFIMGASNELDGMFFIGFLLLMGGMIKFCYNLYKNETSKNQTDENFSLDTDIFKNELKTLIAEFKKDINSKKKSLKKKIQKYQEYLQEQADDFYNFRTKHYLPKLEKLLLDMEYDVFLKDYKIDFKSVNKNNKVKNGTIEDYIAYFQEHTK